jgi:hypothetical protein
MEQNTGLSPKNKPQAVDVTTKQVRATALLIQYYPASFIFRDRVELHKKFVTSYNHCRTISGDASFFGNRRVSAFTEMAVDVVAIVIGVVGLVVLEESLKFATDGERL